MKPLLLSRPLRLLEAGVAAALLLALAGQALLSPQQSRFRYLGHRPAGPDGWVFTLYQVNELESANGVLYQLSYRRQLRTERYLPFGLLEWATVADFEAGRCGSTLYLAYRQDPATALVGALHDVRWRPAYTDSLYYHGGYWPQLAPFAALLHQAQQCQPQLRLP